MLSKPSTPPDAAMRTLLLLFVILAEDGDCCDVFSLALVRLDQTKLEMPCEDLPGVCDGVLELHSKVVVAV